MTNNIASVKDQVARLGDRIDALSKLKTLLSDSSKSRDMLMHYPVLNVSVKLFTDGAGYVDVVMNDVGTDDRAIEKLTTVLVELLSDRVRDCIAAIDVIAAEIQTPPT